MNDGRTADSHPANPGATTMTPDTAGQQVAEPATSSEGRAP